MLLAATAAAYLLALLLVVFWPVPVDRPAQASLDSLLERLHGAGIPAWFDYQLVEWLANVALFVPWGVLGALALAPRHWWLVLVSGLAASAAVETAQYLYRPERFASAADLVANTAGAGLGLLCAAVVTYCARRQVAR